MNGSPKKNFFEQNKQIITNLNKKIISNDTFDYSADYITKKAETDNNEIKKVYNKTPSKGLKSNDDSKKNSNDIKDSKESKDSKDAEIFSILQENKILKQKNIQLEKKNKNLMEIIKVNKSSNKKNINNDDINTNLSINDTANIFIHSNCRNININEFNQNDLYERTNTLEHNSHINN